MKLLILLALCAAANAAPLPPALPTVKRPAPLLSPRHASVPKSAPMAKAFTQASTLPPCPMTCGGRYTESGEFYFVAAALHVRNSGLIMEWSTSAVGPWTFLAGWGPYVEDEWVSGIVWTVQERVWIRAVPGVSVSAAPAAASATPFPGRFVKGPSSKTKPRL